jgi:hypothetical protein
MNMDGYGRLPTDILKHVSLLGATPKITFDSPNLIISSPFMTYKLKLFTIPSINHDSKCEDEKYTKTMIEDIISFSKELKDRCNLYIDGYWDPDMNFITTFVNIQLCDNKIYLNSEENELILPISLLSSLNKVLTEYIDFIQDQSYYMLINADPIKT